MNSVEAFSAQVRFLGYSTPVPTPPTWPNGTPAGPTLGYPVPQLPSRVPAGSVHGYPLTPGNPEGLTVAHIVARAYRLDWTRDAAQIRQIADYVAEQNGIFMANAPIPGYLTRLGLPWPPTQPNDPQAPFNSTPIEPTGSLGGLPQESTKAPRSKKNKLNIGQVVAGLGAAAAGAGRIIDRHENAQNGLPAPSWQNGSLSQGNYTPNPGGYRRSTHTEMISADIADAVPILANIAILLAGQAPPPPAPYGYGTPSSPYYNGALPYYGPHQPNFPTFQATPSPWPQQGDWSMPYYEGPMRPSRPYSRAGADPWGNQMGNIVTGVGALARSISQIFS